jgi:hypothetical protein
MKWANFGDWSGSYKTSRAGRFTGLKRERREVRLLGERVFNSRLGDSSNMVGLLAFQVSDRNGNPTTLHNSGRVRVQEETIASGNCILY